MTSITGPLFAGGCIESSSSTVLKQQDHMMLLNEGGSSQQSGAKRNSLSSASGGAHSTASSRSSSIKSNRGLGTNNKQHSPTSSTNSNNNYYTNEIENVTHCSLCKKKLREPKLLDCLHVYCKSCLASIAQPSSGMVEASSNQHHHLMMPSPSSSASSSTSHTPNQLPPPSIALISPTPSSSSTSSSSSASSAPHLVISCPKCKQDTITKSVESLESDYVMNNILDMIAMDEQALKCLSCTNDQIAMARCSDCACFLCVACVKAHKYMVCFHDHVVLEFAQIQSQYAANLARHQQQQQQPHKSASACDLLATTIGHHRSLSPNRNETQESASSTSLVPIHRPLNCRFHAKEALKFFCNTCQMPVCSECVISEHTQPTHTYERLGDVELARHADEIEAYVRKALEMCSSSGHDENNSASLEKNITYLDEQMQSAREAIEETYETFKSMLDKRRNIMLNELDDRFKDKQAKLIEMHTQIDASMAKLNDVIKFAERVMQNGNSTEILLMKRAIVNQIRFLVRSLPPNNNLEATLDLDIRFGSDESRFERALVDTFGRFYTQKEIKHSYLNNLANMSNLMLNGSGSANSLIAADRDSLNFQQQQQQQFSISRQQQLQQQQQLANLQQLQQHIHQQIGSNGTMNTSPRNGQAENFFDPEWQALVIQAQQQQQQQQQGANQQQMKPPLLDDQLLTLKVLAQQLSASSNEECFANMMKMNNDVAKLAISPPSSSVGLTQQQHVKTMWPTPSSAASSSASSTTSSKFIMNSGGSQSGSNQHSRTHTPAPQLGNQLTMDEMMLMQFSSSAGSSSSSSSSAAPMNSNPIAAQNFTQLSKFMSTTATTATNNLPPGGLVPQPHHHPLISPTAAANMNINDLASLGSTIDLNTLSAVGINAYMAMAMSNNGVDQQLQSSSQSPPLLSTNGVANPAGAIGSCLPSAAHSASSSVATVTASSAAAVNGQYSGNGNLNPPVRQTAKMTNMQIRTKFGILGAGKAQFNAPHGFCLGVDEEIIVADTNNHRIQIFDKNGEWKFMFGSPGRDEGQLWYPRKVAVMRESGKFVVCDRGNERSRMQIFNKSGHFIKKISIRYIDIVAGLGITSNGEIVAVDSVSPTVFRISENGDLLKWFDCSDYMREPSDIAIWGNEYYVCDFKGHCVVVFNEDGSFVRRIGGENITNFPNGIDVSDQGDVLVGDSHGNRFHVAVFAPKGELISEFECPYVKVSRCCGLKITSEGYVVTLAKNNHHVLVLNTLYVG